MATRARFNELTYLLERADPTALASAVRQFPEFAEEARRGPDAGAPADDHEYMLQRARFALQLGQRIAALADARAKDFLRRARAVQNLKLFAIVVGGLAGAATLALFGLEKDVAAQISGIATAAVAVANSAGEFFGKRYTTAANEKAAEMIKASYGLQLLLAQLDTAVRLRRANDELADLMERCNAVAADLNSKAELLGLA